MAIYYSGKMGSCAIGGVTYPLDSWELSSKTQAVEVSNFTIPLGQEAFIPNLIGGTITASGPLTSLGSPNSGIIANRPCAGDYAYFTLGVGIGLSYTILAIIEEINPKQDVKEKATIEIVARITPNPNV